MTQSAPQASGILGIFGITGDLSRKKLLPALYHLIAADLLPEHFCIIGITRRKLSPEDIVDGLAKTIDSTEDGADPAVIKRLAAMLRIVTMDMTKADDYRKLRSTLDEIEEERGACLNRLYYLSIPPASYGEVVELMGEADLHTGCIHGTAASRLMVEKPFGSDLASARALIAQLKKTYAEDQIYRIDHYLAKETAQNIMTFRFNNPVFEAVWDVRYVARIHVLAAESIGIEGRTVFYESVGALRDIIQSHLLALLAIATMRQPEKMDSAHIHAEKLKLLRSIRPALPGQAVRGQYQGYRDEVGHPDSKTETFAAIDLVIDDDRWRGVPVTLTAGKRLDRKTTQITVDFVDAEGQTNTLVFRLQPDEGIAIDLLAKKPGFDNATERVEMSFKYHDNFDGGVHPDAYERVLIDGIRGDQTLFASSDEVIAAWEVVELVVQAWAKDGKGLIQYEPGTSPDQIISKKS